MKICISTYNRKEYLKRIIDELKGYDYTVVNDGSDYTIDFIPKDRLINLPHLGKSHYWIVYDCMIHQALKSKEDNFLFLPDDVYDIDFDRIKELHERFEKKRYFINAINDGRKLCWRQPNYQVEKHSDLTHVGFFDCGGLTNRKTLEGFKLHKPPKPFGNSDNSSGVGYLITNHFNQIKTPMYTAKKSLVFHGDHESKMHPLEIKRFKLISK